MSDLKILIVDDEGAIRDMIRMSLEMAGFQCLEAEVYPVSTMWTV